MSEFQCTCSIFLCNIVSQNLLCNTRWNYNSSKLVWFVTFHQCKGKNISWIKVQLNWVSVPGQMCKSQILLCDRKKTRGGKTTRIKIQFLNGLYYMPLKFISKSHTHTHIWRKTFPFITLCQSLFFLYPSIFDWEGWVIWVLLKVWVLHILLESASHNYHHSLLL